MRMLAILIAISILPCTLQAQSEPTEIGLTDLKLDISTMQGKMVKVTGLLQIVGDLALIKGEPMDMSPIYMTTTHLSRIDRKSLITTCSLLCKATVVGKVSNTALGQKCVDAYTLQNVTGVDMNAF